MPVFSRKAHNKSQLSVSSGLRESLGHFKSPSEVSLDRPATGSRASSAQDQYSPPRDQQQQLSADLAPSYNSGEPYNHQLPTAGEHQQQQHQSQQHRNRPYSAQQQQQQQLLRHQRQQIYDPRDSTEPTPPVIFPDAVTAHSRDRVSNNNHPERPTVSIVTADHTAGGPSSPSPAVPLTPAEASAPLSPTEIPQTLRPGISQQAAVQPRSERSPQAESKKSKRSFFGIRSKDSETKPSKQFGRSLSVGRTTRKHVSAEAPPVPQLDQHEEQSSSGYHNLPTEDEVEGMQSSTAYIDQRLLPPLPQQPQQQSRPQAQRLSTNPDRTEEPYLSHRRDYDSPQSQRSVQHQSPSAKGRRSPQLQEYYQSSSPEQSKLYAARNPPLSTDQISLSSDPRRPSVPEAYYRPSSRQSLGPPSPSHSYSRGPTPDIFPPAARPAPSQRPPQNKMGPRPPSSGHARGEPPQYVQQGGHAPPGTRQKDTGLSQIVTGHEDDPSPERPELTEADFHKLVSEYEKLQAKYNKVKKYFFDKEAQVQQLQNVIANQRMSASRTQLDDNEYATRFTRLDGAIKNLAYIIRDVWTDIPFWLAPMVNKDAHKLGKKEMTAVGRACITRWVMDEILDRHFHPGLDPQLSSQLKLIERNIRNQARISSQEEMENHMAKLSHWRLTTVEGLSEMLATPQAEERRKTLTQNLVEKLVASLAMHLVDPPPPNLGLESGVSMIVELAVGISANMALESREIFVQYPLPGALISENYMQVETTLPPLTDPGNIFPDDSINAVEGSTGTGAVQPLSTGDSNQMTSVESVDNQEMKDTALASAAAVAAATSSYTQPAQSAQAQSPRDKKKSSMFGSIISTASAAAGRKNADAASSAPRTSVSGPSGPPPPSNAGGQGDDTGPRVRLSGFVIVEVRGRPGAAAVAGGNGGNSGSAQGSTASSPTGGNVLVKATVWPI